jgi:hypothetical protein
LLRRSAGGTALSTPAFVVVVPAGVPHIARALQWVPRERCASVLLHRSYGYWQDDSTVGCVLEWPTFWVQEGGWSSVRQHLCPWRPSPLWGTWSRGDICRFFPRPSFLYPRQRIRL